MPEHSEAVVAPAVEQVAAEAQTKIEKANERASELLFGTQKLMLEEFVFLGNEFFDRAKTEMHLFSELVSKMSGAHSVKDIKAMYEECGKHQLEFIRRDCDRVLRNGERVIEATSKLFKSHPLN